MLKIIIVTAQLVLLGSLSMSRVTYGERSAMTFKHLYLNSWDPQYETLPYPPSTGVYALYTREAFYEAIGFALRKYNATEAVSLNGYAFTDPLRPVTVCAEIFNSVRATGYHSELDRDKVCRTFNLLHVDPIDVADAEHTEAFLNSKDLGIAFSRFSRLWLNFSLASPPVHHMDWDRSVECFQFAIRVIFENAGQTGQVVGALDAELIEMACVPTGGSEIPLTSRRVVHLIVDVFAFNVALVSLLLCCFSLYRALNLWKRTVRFFRDHCGQQLSGMLKQFLDVWIFIVACGDLLIICGSSLKFVHSQDILSAYAELAYLLGMGTLVVWVSALRFVEFSSRTHLLLRTLRRSMPSLVRFLTCALVLFFAFVFPAWVILGPFNMKFRTLTATLECLFSLINGDDMYVTFSIIDWSRGIGIFLFSRLFLYSFISLFIYTVLNIFVTIIFEAYEEAKERESFDSEEMGILKQFLAKRVGEQSPEAGTCDSAYEDINRPISGAKSTSFRYRQPRSRVPSVQRQSKRGRPPDRAMSRHRRRQTQARELVGGEAALRAWEASQNLIGQLRNENHLLKERLCNCQLELRTVQRECKVQSARLSKAVGKEADMPAMIERLNAEVRGLQERLRQKRAAADAAERRAAAAEARLAPLLVRRQQRRETNSAGTTATADGDSGYHVAPQPTESRLAAAVAELESLKTSIEFERSRLRDAQRKNEALERNHKAELSVAYEQIRKLKKLNNDLQEQLETVTRNLQEKTKLLELQNIYSHRLPKSVIIQNAGFELQRERRCGLESELNEDPRSRNTEATANRKCSPRFPAIRPESSEKRRRGCRPAVSQISTMVAKMKSGLFARAHTSSIPDSAANSLQKNGKSRLSAEGEKQHQEGPGLPTEKVVDLPAPRARRRKKKSPIVDDDNNQTDFKEPPSEMGDLVNEESEGIVAICKNTQSKPQENLEVTLMRQWTQNYQVQLLEYL